MVHNIEMKKLREIMQAMVRYDLTSVKITENDSSLQLERKNEQIVTQQVLHQAPHQVVTEYVEAPESAGIQPAPMETKPSDTAGLITIESPIIGTFYSASKPGADPYVSVGQKINKGDIIGIIEAMKVMNEVKATAGGIVEEILVQDRTLVEYGTDLMRLRP